MRVLVIGSGGREHALVRALARDPQVDHIVAAPGNPGIGALAELRSVNALDPEAVAELAVHVAADLVVIGPEGPLVAGAADAVRARGIACFGPSADAAQLEGSKAFAKMIMAAAGVPTAMSRICDTDGEITDALDMFGPPYVVKDDALAAGKGVVVTNDLDTALDHARACKRVVIEEYLEGPEVSIFAISDGETVVPLQPAQDFKRVGDDDAGPNTGGMGAYSPLPWAPATLVDDVVDRVLQPTIDEMRSRGTPFAGLLYGGLALTKWGVRVIEFNARFGDPETQVVLARLQTPLAGLLCAAAQGDLADHEPLRWSTDAAVTVVIASEGYPGTPTTGREISGLGDDEDHSYVLHAGTALTSEGRLVSAGGRVLSVVGIGPDLRAAREVTYERVRMITLEGSHHRRDIALAAAHGEPVLPARP